MDSLFYSTLDDWMRMFISAIIMYVLLIIYIRLVGKRSISELNNFDWIVTVSIGAIFASTVIFEDISVVDGALSVTILLLLQFSTTKSIYTSVFLRQIVKPTPQLLLFEGEFLHDNMKNERILQSEIYAAIRQQGLKSVEQVYAIVLETNAKISVIPNSNPDELGFSLSDVQGIPEGLKKDLEEMESS